MSRTDEMKRPSRQALRWVIVFAAVTATVSWIVLDRRGTAADPANQLEVKVAEIGQENCRGTSTSEVSVVRLKLRLEIKNIAGTKLIVSKNIGLAWYGITVKRGNAYTEINNDWMVTDLRTPPSDAPSPDFTILIPGKSFTVETTVYLPLSKELPPREQGALQLDLGTWFYVADAKLFKTKWAKYGELVYQPKISEPLSFRIPPETEFAKCGH